MVLYHREIPGDQEARQQKKSTDFVTFETPKSGVFMALRGLPDDARGAIDMEMAAVSNWFQAS